VWTKALIEMMLPVALEAEADESRRHFSAVQAAAGSLFDRKVPAAFVQGLDRVKADIRRAQQLARGFDNAREEAADRLEELLAEQGIRLKSKGRGRHDG
jgi:hypothetical protein